MGENMSVYVAVNFASILTFKRKWQKKVLPRICCHDNDKYDANYRWKHYDTTVVTWCRILFSLHLGL